jgi:hypothetical protein
MVKAKDINGDMSGWSDPLTVTLTKSKVVKLINVLFSRFLENNPHLFPLQQLIGLQ